jgi:hypothetical protein
MQDSWSSDAIEAGASAAPIAPVGPPAKWEKEADIVVVGTGGGGLAASLKAAENGNTVITVEKVSGPGGATKEASTFFCPGGTRYQNAVKFARPAYPYDPDALVQMMMTAYRWSVDPLLLRKLAIKGPECLDWLGDHGVPWVLDVYDDGGFGPAALVWKGSTAGGLFCRAGEAVTDHVFAEAKKRGAEFIFNTAATALVKDGDRIVGVRARTSKGDMLFIHARKAVILASGGFAVNKPMLEKYAPTAAVGCANTATPPSDTGECIRMGLGAGAGISGFDTWTVFDGGPDWAHEGGTFHHYLYDGATQLLRQPWFGIDQTGRRYPYLSTEPGEPGSNYTDLGTIQMSRPGHRVFVAFDADYEKRVPVFREGACRIPITPDMPNIDRVPEPLAPHDWRDGANRAIEEGVIKKADTLEALEKALGLRPGVLVGAVKEWNDACAAGTDTLPIRPMPSKWLFPITKAPFYGARLGGLLFSTHAGLLVTPELNVVATDGQIIPGLYASFHTAGGSSGESCNGKGILGGAALSLVGGYIAAESAVNEPY